MYEGLHRTSYTCMSKFRRPRPIKGVNRSYMALEFLGGLMRALRQVPNAPLSQARARAGPEPGTAATATTPKKMSQPPGPSPFMPRDEISHSGEPLTSTKRVEECGE